MDLKEAQTKLTAAEDQVKSLTPHATFRTELKTALGTDNVALCDDAKALAAAAIAGQRYKSKLIDELVASDRQKGVVGDKPEDVAEVKASYAALSLVHLERLHTASEKSGAPKRGAQIQGGDPNASPANDALPEDHALKGLLQFG